MNYLVLVFLAATMTYFIAASALEPIVDYLQKHPQPPTSTIHNLLRAQNLDPDTPIAVRYWRWPASSRLGSPALDAQMRKAGTEIDHKAYLDDITAADKLLCELAVNLPLYQRPAIKGTKYGAFGFQDTDWTKTGFTG